MHDQKKIAMLIVRGLADFNNKESDPTKEQETKTPKENAESDDSRMGIEVAMEKFINAVHDRDVKAAVQSFCEIGELSEGVEYFKDDVSSSMHDED